MPCGSSPAWPHRIVTRLRATAAALVGSRAGWRQPLCRGVRGLAAVGRRLRIPTDLGRFRWEALSRGEGLPRIAARPQRQARGWTAPATALNSRQPAPIPMASTEQNELIAAANFIVEAAQKLLAEGGRLQAETLIVSVARLSGSLLLRSFNLGPVPAGSAVICDEANSWGPQLIEVVKATLQQLGECPDDARIRAAMATTSTSASPLGFQDSLDRLMPVVRRWSEVSGLDGRQAGLAAAIATGLLVNGCAEVLPREAGAALAVAGLCEGLKTAPRLEASV